MNDLQSMFDDAQKNRFNTAIKQKQFEARVAPAHVQQNYERIKKMITDDSNGEITKVENNPHLGWEEKGRRINNLTIQCSSSIVSLDVALDCVTNDMNVSEVEQLTTDTNVWDKWDVRNYFSDLIKV